MKVDFIFFDAGGGHRAAANALRQVMEGQGSPFEIRMVNLQEVLDAMDVFRQLTGLRLQDIYNLMLKKGWTLGSPQLMVGMHWVIRLFHPKTVRLLEAFWRERRPEMVVSLVPNLDRALCESLAGALPGVPFVTILTDIADYPPHFWIERQDQHVICGSEMAAQQARELGIPPDHVLRTSGMILNPRFYAPLNVNRQVERMRRGLRPDLPTGLVLFGGEGSSEMLRIAKALNRKDSGIQLILICGKNEALADQLRAMPHRIPMFVQGFTRDVPLYMELADFFIGKPGPGCISEALAKRLPVIVQRNAWTMAHERYNADWVEQMGVGVVVRNFATELTGAVQTMLAAGNYQSFRARAAAMNNSAVYEIPDLLAGILSDHSPRSDAAPGLNTRYAGLSN